MEEEKKKKKNKKKKNKQSKTLEDNGVADQETDAMNENHVILQNINRQVQVSDSPEVQNAFLEKTDADLDRHHNNCISSTSVTAAEKQELLQRQTLATAAEKPELLQRQARSEERIKLQDLEKDLHMQKESGFKEKINQLLDEKATLDSEGTVLEERIKLLEIDKDSGVLKESLIKETISSLNDDNARLQKQVMELEKTRHHLLQENQQLKEDISSLQSQCQNLQSSTVSSSTLSTKYASENEDLNSQMEAVRALVEKLISENADLIEKVNELYIELNGRTATYNLSSALDSDSLNGTAEYASITGGIPKSIEKISAANDIVVKLVEDVSNKDDRIAIDVDRDYLQNSSEIIESEEIIPISLDDNDTQGLELLAQESDNNNGGVPLSDAPLVGAPFRFISFVAKYVSGADLVNKNP